MSLSLPLTITFSGSSFDLSICPNLTITSSSKFNASTQCAAVSTNFEVIREPPHTRVESFLMDNSTCHGYCPRWAGSQPIHLELVIVVEKSAHFCWRCVFAKIVLQIHDLKNVANFLIMDDRWFIMLLSSDITIYSCIAKKVSFFTIIILIYP